MYFLSQRSWAIWESFPGGAERLTTPGTVDSLHRLFLGRRALMAVLTPDQCPRCYGDASSSRASEKRPSANASTVSPLVPPSFLHRHTQPRVSRSCGSSAGIGARSVECTSPPKKPAKPPFFFTVGHDGVAVWVEGGQGDGHLSAVSAFWVTMLAACLSEPPCGSRCEAVPVLIFFCVDEGSRASGTPSFRCYQCRVANNEDCHDGYLKTCPTDQAYDVCMTMVVKNGGVVAGLADRDCETAFGRKRDKTQSRKQAVASLADEDIVAAVAGTQDAQANSSSGDEDRPDEATATRAYSAAEVAAAFGLIRQF
ncbi:hypothetical protein HPB52_025523 [Rhipicephalus sanguineus]|uniref:Uncharacterized protein n=1 Tax=Rhipicephalus sanguineus TaxID=34632 RepID=A0A9D4YRD0_RHISA|nr:hypothetical protein HPB52_025523 [Rhipicephalus sanguineus]